MKLQGGFDKLLNLILIVLIFHLGSKLFVLTVLRNSFLYNNNATGFGLAYGPLLFLAARIYLNKPVSRQRALLHLLPFGLFALTYVVNGAAYVFKIIPATFVSMYVPWYPWLAATSLFAYPAVTLQELRRDRNWKLPNADIQFALVRDISVLMLVSVVLGVTVFLLLALQPGNKSFDVRLITYISLSIIPVLILRYKMQTGNSAMKQSLHTEAKLIIEQEGGQKQYKKSALDIQMMDQYELILTKFMEKSKIYLEAEISLELLSTKVKIPKHHLTQLLNERYKKNFYVFINEYRIIEAKQKLETGKDDSILSLAYDCGFNSKSSFNNYFKKITGLTPSEYRKEQFNKQRVKVRL
jgi:AraC-like DNA-binding protein